MGLLHDLTQRPYSQKKPRSSSSTGNGIAYEECRTKLSQRVSIHVGVWTRKKHGDADSFRKCIQDAAKETLPVLMRWKEFAFAYVEARSAYNSECVARSAGDFNQEKHLSRDTGEAMRDEQAGFRPGRSTIDQTLNELSTLFIEAVFSTHSAPMELPGEFFRLLDDMNQRGTAAHTTRIYNTV
ncbi:hypothetical protein RB195_012053 [Necator americanus]|uniref:Uncharacterized protein n=1 Tax=Necator americanus TaxID=51031 RepID=A0ABR1D6X9_NECAM